MIIILLFAFLLNKPFNSNLLKNTSQVAIVFQQKCEQILPSDRRHAKILASLICGQNLTDAELKNNLIKTSLIHIFIISGSHLVFLNEFLSFLRIPVFVRLLLLGTYSIATGWQPPAVRALLTVLVRTLFQVFKYSFPGDLIVLISGMGLLILFPEWWSSLSLVMSWCAAIALGFTPLFKIKNKVAAFIVTNTMIFLFMLIPLWGVGALHPLSIVYNLVLAPVVSFILLPLAFLSALIPSLLSVFDFALSYFQTSLKLFSEPIFSSRVHNLPIQYLWIWVFACHLFFHFLRLHIYQGKDLSQ
jgi:ComEC/Rec2-related protein